MSAVNVPRVELFDRLGCDGGKRLSTGGFLTPNALVTTESLTGIEQAEFSIARTTEAAGVIRENHILRIWRSDTDYEEWPVAIIDSKRGVGATVSVTARALIYRLGDCGWVTEWQTTPIDGMPQLDVGVVQLSVSEIIQTYIISNPDLNAVIPYVSLGTVDPTVLLDLSWSWASPLEVLLAIIDALQAKDALCELWFLRNGSTGYTINILNTPD